MPGSSSKGVLMHSTCYAWFRLTFKAVSVDCSLGGIKATAHAAFPSGLPEELLGASAAPQAPFSEGSDSDHSSKCVYTTH